MNKTGQRTSVSSAVIIGGGPAGSSLAIRLAKAGVEVTLAERDRFPRHKLCGEFISPECLRHFDELGVRDEMLAAGGASIERTRFFSPGGRSVEVASSVFGGNALSLSRKVMDTVLLERARQLGVTAIEGAQAVGVDVDGDSVTAVEIRSGPERRRLKADIYIDATGRARVLEKLVSRTTGTRTSSRSRFVAFKNHLTYVTIDPGTCEIHFFRGGYGGLSPIEDGLANLCFIVTAEAAREHKGDASAIIAGPMFANVRAAEALQNAEPVGEWLAVAVEGFGRRETSPAENLFAVGDAAAFIDPFTGSGMLMALESSSILADSVSNPLSEVPKIYAERHLAAFRRRLATTAILRRGAFLPIVPTAVITALQISRGASDALARLTRNAERSLAGRP